MRELKSELGKYAVIFLFIAGTISFVSGFLVANDSMSTAYDEGFEKYNIEDGNFELSDKADKSVVETLEKENLTVFENYYKEEKRDDSDSTLRIFKNREEVNKACLMSGEFPQNENQIAIDRMYAENNDVSVGDTLSVDGKKLTVTGLVALSDYSALFQNSSEMMFDAVKFGVAVMTEKGFDSIRNAHLHYCYSWKYNNAPENDTQAKEMSERFLGVLAGNAPVIGFIPQYANQAIHFAGNDISQDMKIMAVFLYIVILIIAFIFAITISNTITKEATVIGTLRALGYSRGELLRHYMTMPLIVILFAALVGNIVGYTYFKGVAASTYYGSYCLPTYVTRWNINAFVKTTIIPLAIMFLINLFVLSSKLKLSPLKFIRRDLSLRKKKKAFKLSTKIGIMKRFRIRVIFQNIPNYITIFIGIFLANVIILFGFMLTPMLDNYQEEISAHLISNYQYVLKAPQDTKTDGAEKYCVESLKTPDGKLKSEEVSIFGINDNSKYVSLDFDGSGVFISNAYAEKHNVKKGDSITLKESYGTKQYTFNVQGIYDYPASLAVFMDKSVFNETFGKDAGYFNGYFSNNEIKDIDEMFIATVITQDDMTKISRQLNVSIGSMMNILLVFGIVMFMLIIYLLSKIIIEKNSQSISMAKILGYTDGEINSLYIITTSIVVIGSLIVTIPIVNAIMKYICVAAFSNFSGWLPYYMPFTVFIKMAAMGIAAYSLIAFTQMKKVKKIPLGDALKNVE